MPDSSKISPFDAEWWDAHHRFIASLIMAVVAFLLLGHLTLAIRFLAAWNVFAGVAVLLAWWTILTADPYEVRRNSSLQDSSRTVLFAVVLSASLASIGAVLCMLGTAAKMSAEDKTEHIALSLGSVLVSWVLVHTLFTLVYAHAYYADARTHPRDKVAGGLRFPEQELEDEKAQEQDAKDEGKERCDSREEADEELAPDYLDFAYFAFVIGMTFQVSDVEITTKKLRRRVLLHGLISFAFNTSILALFVNILAGMSGGNS